MNKKVLKLGVFMGVIAIISVKVMSMTNIVEIEELEDTNGIGEVVPLNYHYIRERNVWNKGIEVLTHDKELTTYNVYEDEFQRQIDSLIEQDVYFATLEQVNYFREIGKFPEKCVWISFDDADVSVYERAYPILKEKGIPFTMFVIAGQVGNDDFNNLKICSWDQLREMRDSGLVSFGSHTYDMHYLEEGKAVFLHQHNYQEFAEDIKKSKQVLEKELQVEITSIAYPFGEVSSDIVELVKDAGYKSGYILAPEPINEESGAYYQSRYLISENCFKQLKMDKLGNK